MADNQVREDRVMSRIEVVASKSHILAEVETLKGFIEHLCSSATVFVLDPSIVDPDPTDVAFDCTIVSHPIDLGVNLPLFFMHYIS